MHLPPIGSAYRPTAASASSWPRCRLIQAEHAARSHGRRPGSRWSCGAQEALSLRKRYSTHSLMSFLVCPQSTMCTASWVQYRQNGIGDEMNLRMSA